MNPYLRDNHAPQLDELVGAGAERAVPDFEAVRWPV
jgi:hypothetical protein